MATLDGENIISLYVRGAKMTKNQYHKRDSKLQLQAPKSPTKIGDSASTQPLTLPQENSMSLSKFFTGFTAGAGFNFLFKNNVGRPQGNYHSRAHEPIIMTIGGFYLLIQGIADKNEIQVGVGCGMLLSEIIALATGSYTFKELPVSTNTPGIGYCSR